MASYGKNFDYRIPPDVVQKDGRYVTPAAGSALPIGAPIEIDTSAGVDAYGRQIVKLSTSGTNRAQGSGQGILVFEHILYLGNVDPNLTTYSDFSTVPVASPCQLVHGRNIKVLLKNTAATTFLNVRSYAARVMVAGLGGATPGIVVGDYLYPGTGNDTDGWWAKADSAAHGWLRVLEVDNTRVECVCETLI